MNLFHGIFPVHYGQFYFLSEGSWEGDMKACFHKQRNGLCGAAVDGVVFFITGLHSGNITVSVNFHKSCPEVDSAMEEIVEASFRIPVSGMALEAWGEEVRQEIKLPPGGYRLRYGAKNFGLAEELERYEEGDVESYVIDIWPSPYAEDSIVKSTREGAAYWHSQVTKYQV